MIGMGIGGVFIAAGIVALCNGYRLQNRVVIGVSGESMIFTPGSMPIPTLFPCGCCRS